MVLPARLCLCLGFCPRNQSVGGLSSCSIYGSGYPGNKEKNIYIYKGDYFYLHTICLHKVTQRLRKTNWLLAVGYVYLHGTCVHSSQQARNGPRRRAEVALREDI